MTRTATSPTSPHLSRALGLRAVIGDTPLLAVHCRFEGAERTVFAKLESANLTGSIKDRMALGILERARADGSLREGDLIVEATSGNTGIALAAVGRALDHTVRIYMPDWMSSERVQLIRALGAEIVPVSSAEGGFRGCIERAEAFAAEHGGAFLPRQFDNEANPLAHAATTGPEIAGQLTGVGLAPTAFVAGVGTGGTVVGVGRYLRTLWPAIAVHPLEPANSPTLRTGRKEGSHRIQGISDEFVPSIVDLAALAPIVDVWDGDAIVMARRLADELGLGVGISSGANFLGALLVGAQQGGDSVAATVFPDSNKKYVSTDLCRAEPLRGEYVAPRVELLGYDVIARPSALGIVQ